MHHYNEEIWDFQDWLVEDLNPYLFHQCQGQLNTNFHFSKHQVLQRGINASGDAKDGGRDGKNGNEDGKDGGSDNVLPLDSKPSTFSFPSNWITFLWIPPTP